MLTKTTEGTQSQILNKILWVLFPIFLFFTQIKTSIAQTPQDRATLWEEYHAAQHDTIKVLRLLDLGYTYLRTNPDSAEILDKEALDLAQDLKYFFGKAKALNELGLIEWARGNYPGALKKIRSAYTLHKSLGNQIEMAKCLNNIGYMYYENGQYEEAIENHQAYLEIVIANKDKKREAGALHNIGMVHQAKGDYLEAMDFYYKSVTVKKEMGDSSRLSNTLDALGDIFYELKDYSLADAYYQRGLKIREKEDNKLGIVVSLYNIGRNFKEEEKYEQSLTIFKKGKSMAEELKTPKLLAYHLEGIGSIYKKTGQFEQALHHYQECKVLRDSISDPKGYSLLLNEIADLYISLEKWEEAFDAATKAFEMAALLEAKEEMKDAAFCLSKIYGKRSDFEKAYQYLNLVNVLKDSLFDAEKNREIAVNQVRHERDHLEDKKEKINRAKELLNQRKFNTLLMGSLLLITLLFSFLYLAFRQRKRVNLELLQRNQELRDKKQHLERLNTKLQSTNQKLELVGQKLQQFAFAASHDLKESIRSVTSFSQLLEKKIKNSKKINLSWITYLDYISSSGKRMDNILADLLSYLNLGAKSSDFVQFDLNEVVQNVQIMLEPEVSESGAQINIVNKLPQLLAHPHLIEQLYLKLIDNAIKFRKREEPLKVEVGVEHDRKDQLVFFVKDNGIGLEKRYYNYIFKPFKRLHDRNLSGSGLGLSICKNIVNLYEGNIKVESGLDQGSIFRFTLPKARVKLPVEELISDNIS